MGLAVDKPSIQIRDGVRVIRYRSPVRPLYLLLGFLGFFTGALYLIGWSASVHSSAAKLAIDISGWAIMGASILAGYRGWRLGYSVDPGRFRVRNFLRDYEATTDQIRHIDFQPKVGPYRIRCWVGHVQLANGRQFWVPTLFGGLVKRGPVTAAGKERMRLLHEVLAPS